MSKFTGEEGELISVTRVKELTHPHKKREKDFVGRGENFVQAEFFGLKKFNKLIEKYGDKCAGFRVYYGNQLEEHGQEKIVFGKGKTTSRLIIVPVGADGVDLLSEGGLGFKDAQEEAMAGGPLCPRQCG